MVISIPSFAAQYSGNVDQAFGFGLRIGIGIGALVFILFLLGGSLKKELALDSEGISQTTRIFGFIVSSWDMEWGEIVDLKKIVNAYRLQPANHPVQLIFFENFDAKEQLVARLEQAITGMRERSMAVVSPTAPGGLPPKKRKITPQFHVFGIPLRIVSVIQPALGIAGDKELDDLRSRILFFPFANTPAILGNGKESTIYMGDISTLDGDWAVIVSEDVLPHLGKNAVNRMKIIQWIENPFEILPTIIRHMENLEEKAESRTEIS